jgi:hypothetical protein
MKKDILKKIIEMKNVEDRKNYIETLKIMIYTGINLSESEIEIIESYINDEKELKKRYLDLVISEELNSDTEPPVEDDELDKLMNDDDDSDDSVDSADNNSDNDIADDNSDDDDNADDLEISREGVGILPLIAEIQKRLANGEPSPIEIAAIKSLKKILPQKS